jgi:predicted nucleic acid-binding protein
VRFVDTNVLLYAVSRAKNEAGKAARALQVLDSADVAVSVQVLQEFYVQATRPSRSDRLTHDQAAGLIASWLRFTVGELTVPLMQAALSAADRYRINYWDAMILESARALGCHTLLSEDLSDGRDYDGVRVRDPFKP